MRRLARDLARALERIPRAEPAGQGRRVFISGADDDLDLVRATAKALHERHGLRCRLALHATPGFDRETDAADLRRDMEEGLTGSDALVLLYRKGPVGQLRHTITEVQKLRARIEGVPGVVDLCQPHPDPDATGLYDDTLNVIVTLHDCAEDCADRVAARLKGGGKPGTGGNP
jgi:hypothetical protein